MTAGPTGESPTARHAGGPGSTAIEQAVGAAIARHASRPGALLPLLHDVQDQLGWLPAECVAPIARALNLSRAEVHGTITFYHHFRTHPVGRHVVQICQAESCQSMGCGNLMQHARQVLGCDVDETTRDGAFTLEPVYCLGQCAASPAMMIDEKVYARVTAARFDTLVADVRARDAS